MSNIMRLTIVILFTLGQAINVASATNADPKDTDWRITASEIDKINRLIKVIPSTSDIIFQMGERYKNIYWAAKMDKWKFAEYQMEEMLNLIRNLIITRPKRAVSAKHFLHNGFEELSAAIKKQNMDAFKKGFSVMRYECLSCHAKNNHEFIRLPNEPAKGSSPVLDVE